MNVLYVVHAHNFALFYLKILLAGDNNPKLQVPKRRDNISLFERRAVFACCEIVG